MDSSTGDGSDLSPTSTADPMDVDDDVDPIDGGPKSIKVIPGSKSPPGPALVLSPSNSSNKITIEEAREAIEMLRGDDVAGRVDAAYRLEAVADVLGEERTREELLPFLTDGVDDEDEVLLAMATSLERMVSSVGGPAYAHLLLRPLELLLSVEETAVREAAMKSALAVANVLPTTATTENSDQNDGNIFQREFAPMMSRLASKEWFTARISASGLIAVTYPKLTDPQQQEEHMRNFAQLCRDDTSMVRRVAAQHLGTMVQNVVETFGRDCLAKDGSISEIFMPLYEEFASNDQPDSVRLQTTENCVAFGQVMSGLSSSSEEQTDENSTTTVLEESEVALLQRILPLIVATIDDRSWRVRWTAAAKFAGVIKAYDALPESAGVMDSLVPAYEKLLQDPEAEVRTAATFNLACVARCKARVPAAQNRPQQDGGDNGDAPGGADGEAGVTTDGPRVSAAERLVKRVTSLTEDDSEHVRAALAMVATELAPILGKDATITYLVPPVLLLLRDAASEVRLNLISSLSALNEVIGVDLLSQSLLPAILDLAQDGKWRIRLAIIQHMPLLAEQLGQDFFTEKLVSFCVGWLGDDIATIRKAAATNLKELTSLFGTNWAIEFLIPSIMDIRRQESYLRRLTALSAFSRMAEAMDADTVRIEVLPVVLEMATDGVANIRFNVAKELQSLAPICGSVTYEAQIKPVLTMLTEDDDSDVRFFAEISGKKLDDHFSKMSN